MPKYLITYLSMDDEEISRRTVEAAHEPQALEIFTSSIGNLEDRPMKTGERIVVMRME